IGQEANVEDEVGVAGDAVAIAEADAGNQHRALFGIAEALGDEVAEFVDVEFGGVDYNVGKFADRLHHLAFVAETFADAEMFADRMRTARFAVATQKSVFTGFDEDERDGMLKAEMFEERGEFLELRAFAGVDEKRGAGEVAFTGSVQLGKNRDE